MIIHGFGIHLENQDLTTCCWKTLDELPHDDPISLRPGDVTCPGILVNFYSETEVDGRDVWLIEIPAVHGLAEADTRELVEPVARTYLALNCGAEPDELLINVQELTITTMIIDQLKWGLAYLKGRFA